MKIEKKIIPPKMPNFVRFEKKAGLRQDGIKLDDGFDIANFTESEAKDFAELMKTEFMAHWEFRKNNKS